MKSLGQNIVDFLTRFKNSVYFENVENGTTDTDKFLIIGASGKLKYRTGTEVKSDIGAGSGDGDITNVIAGDGLSGGSSEGEATLNIESGQTGITSIKNTSLVIGANANNEINFGTTTDRITFKANGADQLTISDGLVAPRTTNDIDLGSASFEFKDAFFDGTVTSDAFVGPLSGNVEGNVIGDLEGNITGSAATVTAGTQSSITTLANVTTVGTIGTGVWQGTPIATAYIADDAVTFAKALGVTPNIFDNKIKLLPSDFMANDDGGNTKFGVGYVDHAGSTFGMRAANSNTELFAFVSIPQGMTATHVDIFDKNTVAFEVFEIQINATTMVSKGSGNCNTTVDITDVASTATNFLGIRVTTTSVNDKVYGGTVTIA